MEFLEREFGHEARDEALTAATEACRMLQEHRHPVPTPGMNSIPARSMTKKQDAHDYHAIAPSLAALSEQYARDGCHASPAACTILFAVRAYRTQASRMRAPQYSDGATNTPDGGKTTPGFADAAHRVSGRIRTAVSFENSAADVTPDVTPDFAAGWEPTEQEVQLGGSA